MNWNNLNTQEILDDISKESQEKPVVLFKHSTSCSISNMALNRLERKWNDAEMSEVKPYLLDLLANRDLSNAVAEKFGVTHQSPQILVIKNNECVYNDSHMGISYPALKAEVEITAD